MIVHEKWLEWQEWGYPRLKHFQKFVIVKNPSIISMVE